MSSTPKGVALITGASTGIGAIYADRLAKRGHDLILAARDQDRMETLAHVLRAETGVKVEVIKADLTKREDLLGLEQRLRDDASISVLVNNAGMSVGGLLVGADPDAFETLVQLNVTAALRLAIAAATGFVARKHGLIINIASVLALVPERFNGAYSGSKAFLLNLSQSLNSEVAEAGVRVQAVLPGATRTEIWKKSGVDMDNMPAGMLMDAEVMVDAALAGLDLGELVTIPALPDITEWDAMQAARQKMGPNLSRDQAAARYTA